MHHPSPAGTRTAQHPLTTRPLGNLQPSPASAARTAPAVEVAQRRLIERHGLLSWGMVCMDFRMSAWSNDKEGHP